MIYNPHFSIESIFGTISLTFVSTSILFKKDDLSLGILVFALILSTFNLVKFGDAFDATMGFFHLIPLILLLVLIFSRLGQLMSLREKWFGDEQGELEKAQERKITIYKREFQNLSLEELIRKEKNETLVGEAKIAIYQLLKEKGVNMNTE